MTALKQNINIAGREFFQTSLVTYLILTLAETLRAGTVSNFFNMNYLLLVVLITGLAMVITEEEMPANIAATEDGPSEPQGARNVTLEEQRRAESRSEFYRAQAKNAKSIRRPRTRLKDLQ